MTTAITRTFRNGNSEAVRLPKGLGYGPGVELRIVRTGDTVTLSPVHGERPNAGLIARLRAIPNPEDGIQTREPFDDPERPGL